MKNTKYRAVIVGCGKIGALFESEKGRAKPASHAGAIAKNTKTELVALVDINAKNLAAAGKIFPHAARYASLAECLSKEQPDIVVIATPPSGRLSLIRACVKTGVKIIVCEKPLATSVRGGRAIGRSLQGSGTTFILNYQRRFSALFKQVREDIRRGAIGHLEQITCYYSNGLYNNGGHIIDALQYLIADKIISVRAIHNTKNNIHPIGDNNVDALLSTKGGTTIALQSFDQTVYAIHDIHLMGTKGAISITGFGQSSTRFSVGLSQFAGLKQLEPSKVREPFVALSATAGAIADAIESFEHHRQPESGLKSGLEVLRVLDALSKSASQKGKMTRV